LKTRFCYLLSVCSLIFTSCNVFNRNEEIPAFVSIPKYSVSLTSDTSFVSDIGIKSVWVYQNEDYQGTYDAPARFPILNTDKKIITLRGGVYENGLSAFQMPYPFWQPVVYSANLIPGETVTFEPVFTYLPNISYPLNEGFENSDVRMEPFGLAPDTASIVRTVTDKYQGNYSGFVQFDSLRKLFEVQGTDSYVLPGAGSQVWIEITFKSELEMQAGLVYTSGTTVKVINKVTLLPKSEWTTIYLNMTPDVTNAPDDAKFRIYFRADGGGATRTLNLDNLKVLHFTP